MGRSTQKDSESRVLGYFPVPYPDESYYSILCRYMVHTGLPSSNETCRVLFGRVISPRATLLMPFMSSRVPGWVSPETGLNEELLTRDHTAYGYLIAFHGVKAGERILAKTRKGEKCSTWVSYRTSISSSYLRYCPVCAYDEKIRYGEMYWHRMHQLDGVYICDKHNVALVESNIKIYNTKRTFFPASCVLKDTYEKDLESCMDAAPTVANGDLEKYRQICRDIRWIMQHGTKAGGIETLIQGYNRSLMNRGWMKEPYGNVDDAEKLRSDISCYFGKTFLESLHITLHDYLTWDYVMVLAAKYMTPLQHVLMMEYLSGSAEEFFKTEIFL